MKSRLLLSVVAAWLALTAPAWSACPEAGGIGGTGVRAEGGIGGTGARAEGGIGGTGAVAGDGIGGTGAMAGDGIGGTGAIAGDELGVVGVITGFGSICVNGVEVHYDSTTPVTVNGQPGAANALALGQTVAVRAVGSGAEARARTISVLDAAVGPVTAVDRAAGTLHVVGQSVRLGATTVFGPGLSREAVRGASAGEMLRVSGLRLADGTIAATRVDRAAPGAALVYGPLDLDANGAPRVGGAHIEATDAAMRALAAARGPVLVAGRAEGGRMVAEQIVADPLGTSLAPGRFVAQGYVDQLQAGSGLRAGGLQYSVGAQASTGGLARDQLIRVYGHTDMEGRRVVERIDFLAEPLNPRPQPAPRAAPLPPPAARAAADGRGPGNGSGGDSSGRSASSDRGGPGPSGTSGSGRGPGRLDDRPERPERPGRPDRVERPERPEGHGGGPGPH
jgi:uncharacterized protein DUF5666